MAASFAVQSSQLRGGISSQAQGKGTERAGTALAALCHGTHPCLLVGVEGQDKSREQQQHHCREFLPAPGSPASLVDKPALRVNQLWSAGKATAGGSSAAYANEEGGVNSFARLHVPTCSAVWTVCLSAAVGGPRECSCLCPAHSGLLQPSVCWGCFSPRKP